MENVEDYLIRKITESEMGFQALNNFFDKIAIRVEAINDRTKRHTKDIKLIEKEIHQLKNFIKKNYGT